MAFLDYSIEKNSAIPLYFQLKQIILSEIKNGSLKSNDRLPIEKDFCDMYDLSRTTVRQAFTELVSEGHLYKEKNRGVFVATPRAKIDSIYSTHYYNEEAKASGFTPSYKITEMQIVPAPADVAKSLQIKAGEDVIHIEKLCYANDALVSISDYYFLYPLCAVVMDQDTYRKHSAYDLLNENAETRISHIEKTLCAYSANEDEAMAFHIPIGAPMILADDIGYSVVSGLPISFEHVRLVGSRTYITWEFQMNSRA
ncbi:MAG: GntR family transcriptional regulator [Firmicutes bacterium]|nr:GntR family transcriptional regulator [Bacillota bacterium]